VYWGRETVGARSCRWVQARGHSGGEEQRNEGVQHEDMRQMIASATSSYEKIGTLNVLIFAEKKDGNWSRRWKVESYKLVPVKWMAFV
jgi:hypothetical protein